MPPPTPAPAPPLALSLRRAAFKPSLSTFASSPATAFASLAALMSFDQNVDLSLSGATSFSLNISTPDAHMHRMLTTVSAKLMLPVLAQSAAVQFSLPTNARPSSNFMSAATAQHMPALTAGGRRLADIATPTSDEVLFPSVERATPAPDGTAMAMPVRRPATSPLEDISEVGQVEVKRSPSTHTTPRMTPRRQHIRRDVTSVLAPLRISDDDRMTWPKDRASTGPMMGDTSMLATITTVFSLIKPIPARRDAIRRRER